MKHDSLILYTKDHTLINISEAKEHSSNNGFLCEEKQAIQTSNDINEAHEAIYSHTQVSVCFRIRFIHVICANLGASFAFSFHFSFMHHAGMI